MMWRFLLLFLFTHPAHARVFDFEQYTVGTYFKGNYGLTGVGKDAYEHSSGTGNFFSDSPTFNWGGEAGLLLATGSQFGIRLGYELVSPQKQSGISGTDSGGTQTLTLESSVIGKFPVAHIEMYLSNNSKTSHFILSAGGGYGTVDMKNSYSNAAFPSYTEKGTATTYMLEAATGFEFLFTDNITILADLGYRYVPKTNFKAQNTFTNAYGAVITKGDILRNADGSARQLDIGGAWIGLGFRFYIKL